jgi:hypothetical protein
VSEKKPYRIRDEMAILGTATPLYKKKFPKQAGL